MPSRTKPHKAVDPSIQLTSREVLQWLLTDELHDLSDIEGKIRSLSTRSKAKTLEKQILISKRSKFLCSVKQCSMSFSRPDNLSRHYKKTLEAAHIHVASIMERKYCQVCLRDFCRQCDFWRHMRSHHPDVDLTTWQVKRPAEGCENGQEFLLDTEFENEGCPIQAERSQNNPISFPLQFSDTSEDGQAMFSARGWGYAEAPALSDFCLEARQYKAFP